MPVFRNRYRILCNTCGNVEEWANVEPTECPNNPGHEIQAEKTAIMESLDLDVLAFTFQNDGAVLNTGVQSAAYLEVPFNCAIEAVNMFGAPSGSVVIDLWRDEYANYPPTDADSITASAPPTISGGVKSEDTTMTGWTKVLTAGDGILPNIDSVTNMTWVKLVLMVSKIKQVGS